MLLVKAVSKVPTTAVMADGQTAVTVLKVMLQAQVAEVLLVSSSETGRLVNLLSLLVLVVAVVTNQEEPVVVNKVETVKVVTANQLEETKMLVVQEVLVLLEPNTLVETVTLEDSKTLQP